MRFPPAWASQDPSDLCGVHRQQWLLPLLDPVLQRCRGELPGAWEAQRSATLAGQGAPTGEEIVQAAILTELAVDVLNLLQVVSSPAGVRLRW